MPEATFQEDVPGQSPLNVSGEAEKTWFDTERAGHEHKMRQLELGWIGRPFGGGAEKSANIAIVTIILCLGISWIIASQLKVATQADLLSKLVSPFLSLVTLALGYRFGSGKKS